MVGIAFLLLLSVQFVSGLDCRENWQEFGGRCYRFLKFLRKWDDAANFCLDNQAQLVEIDTIERQIWLTEQMKNQSIDYLWTGGTSEYTKGELVWIPSGRPIMPHTLWHSQEPDNPENETCALLSAYGYYSWTSEGCEQKNSYVCMKKLAGLTCEEGFLEFKGTCYSFNFDHVPWRTAVERCFVRRADLLEIVDRGVNFWLGDKLMNMFPWMRPVWMAATTQFSDGQWMWLKSHRTLRPFFIWSWVEQTKRARIRCNGFVVMNAKYYGKWETDPYTTLHPFVCERNF